MTVPGAFDRGARSYDRLVGMNPGYHTHLRRSAGAIPAGAQRVLDAGCGTGASTRALLAMVPDAHIVAVDASAGMLAQARRKTWPAKVVFVESRIEDLAAAGISGPFDAIFAAYLVRNLPDPDGTLAEFRRLLAPGGTLVVHEYSVADSLAARLMWTLVCWTVIIPLGGLADGDTRLYRYLWRSVLRFDGVSAFCQRLRRAGFSDVRTRSVTGWQRGIVHTFRACR